MTSMSRLFSKSLITAFSVSVLAGIPSAHAEPAVNEAELRQSLQLALASQPSSGKTQTDVYIVEFNDEPLMSYQGGLNGLAATKPAANASLDMSAAAVGSYKSFLTVQQNQALQNCGVDKSNKIYEYTVAFNGMAALMSEAQAELMRTESTVRSVVKDSRAFLTTDSTREFLELNKRRDGAWRRGYTGEDVIVGVLDSGIVPEHPSFADVPTPRRGDRGRRIPYGPPPAKWQGDECDFGNTEFFAGDVAAECSNKLLGARTYVDGFLRGRPAAEMLSPNSSLSARDDNGHGSAAASNAVGNYGVQAVIDGEEVGDDVISGVAPRARLAVYKVCWDGPVIPGPGVPDDDGCFLSDSMAAIDQAILDGVDVINFSVGGPSSSFGGASARAFLRAATAGIHVATSAGNSGPNRATLGSPANVPWITAVGAINDNQNTVLGINVDAPASLSGSKIALEGEGAVRLEDTGAISGSVVLAQPADGCAELTNPEEIEGNIALIIRGGCGFNDKYIAAETAGATAIVVYNDGTAPDRINPLVMGGLTSDRIIPGVMIKFPDGDALAAATGAEVTLDPEIQISLENTVVGFSSRGQNTGATDIIKPDVTAPGVNILGAETTTENEDEATGKTTTNDFQYISGTSFSSPHVAGVLALLVQANPEWTPAMTRSAMMTTGRQNLITEFDNDPATPFDIGAGHVVPNAAFEPGLVYDAGFADYAAFSCGNNVQQVDDAVCEFLEITGASFDGSELNLPSIGVGELVGSQTVTRVVTSVAKENPYRRRQRATTYKAVVDAPDGVNVTVTPRRLRLRPGDTASYQVTFDVTDEAKTDEFSFGSVTWVERGKRRYYRPRHRSYYGHYFDYFFRNFFGNRYYYGRRGEMAKEVRSPIAVRPVALSAPASVSATGTDGSVSIPVKFGFAGEYNAELTGLSATEIDSVGPVVSDGDDTNNPDFNFSQILIPEGATHLRLETLNADTTTPGADDIDLRLLTCDDFSVVARSEGPTSDEVINISDPADCYFAIVVFFSAANGGDSVDYNLYRTIVSGDAGNAAGRAPESADLGGSTDVLVEYSELEAGNRYLGVLSHQNVDGEISRTLINVDTNQ